MNFNFDFNFGRSADQVITEPPISSGVFLLPDGEVAIPYYYATRLLFTGGQVESFALNGVLPSGLSLNTTSGVISGTPTTDVTLSGISVTGTNIIGSDTTNTSGILIAPLSIPVVIGAFNPIDGHVGTAYSYDTAQLFSGVIDSFAMVGALPGGLTLNVSTGEISGTPTTGETVSGLAVTATNTSGGVTTNTADIDIAIDLPVLIGAFNPHDSTMGSPYFYDVSVLFSGVIDSFSLNGSLPTGLSLNTLTGEISGTPTVVETVSGISVSAVNHSGGTETNTADIIIIISAPIASGTFALTNGVIGNLYSYNAAALFTGGAVETYSLNNILPDGLNLNTLTGEISGTPTTEEVLSNISITGTNSTGSATTNESSITIEPASNFILNLDGTNWAELSEPFIATGDFEIEVAYNTVLTGVAYNILNDFSVSSAGIFVTPTDVTDILVDGISVGLGSTAPNDGLDHIIKFIGSNI